MEERCVMCGEIIPEGTQVCIACKLATSPVPCRDCRDRTIDCHVYCARYIEYFKAKERARKIRFNKHKEDEYFIKRTKERKDIMRKKGDLK